LEQKARGRTRRYCSPACRAKAYRLRKKRQAPTRTVAHHHVQVVNCPEDLFGGRTFRWSDFQASLGVWSDGMRVVYQGTHYEVHGERLVEAAESENASS
jgi:hypothetical protein